MATGIFTSQTETGHDLPALITPDGRVRLLARTPPHGGKMFAARRVDSAAVIPRSEWKPFNRVRQAVPILDQGQVGSCNGHAWASALMEARDAAGQEFQLLSASFAYAQMNGGVDQGSSISDGAAVVQKYGICLDSEVPEGFYTSAQIRRRAPGAYTTALRFRIDPADAVSFTTFDEAVSLALLGFHLIISVTAGGEWSSRQPLDQDGVPAHYRGAGNHAVNFGEELVYRANGEPLLGGRNSWSANWGQLGGRFRIGEAFIAQQTYFEGYAIRWPAQDPQDPSIGPVAA